MITLILPGAGINGCVLLGALYQLMYRDKIFAINDISRIRATSVGSVIGLLILVGYTPIEILKIFEELQVIVQDVFTNFMSALYNDSALMSSEILSEFLEEKVRKKIDISPTFEELHSLSGNILFEVCVTNLLEKRSEYSSYLTHPDESVIKWVVSSSAVPFLIKNEESYLVDGGVLDNLPVPHLEDDTDEVFIILDIIKGHKIPPSPLDDSISPLTYMLLLLETIQVHQINDRQDRINKLKYKIVYKIHLETTKSFSFDLWSDHEKLYKLFIQGLKSIYDQNNNDV